MSDWIFIEKLSFLASIGVFDWEKTLPQKLVVDVEMLTDISSAAASDDLSSTLDYAAVSQHLIQLAQAQHHDLIETLAEKMAASLLAHFPTHQLTLTLRKPGAVASAKNVGVRITRSRRQEHQGQQL